MHRLLALAAVMLLGACKEPPFDRRDGGVSVPDCEVEPTASLCDEASEENALFSYAASVCKLMLDCCSAPERSRVAVQMLTEAGLTLALLKEPALLEDPRACRRAVTLSLFAKYQTNIEALDDDRQQFDIEQARTCLGWLKAGAEACAPGLILFDDAHQPKSCGKLFSPGRGEGEKCYDDADCVDARDGGSSVCESRTAFFSDGGIRIAVDGRCRPTPSIGQSCPLPQSTCEAGAYCAFNQTCQPKVQPGGVCAAAPCDALSFCSATQSPPRCQLRSSFYGPCASSAECFEGLECDPKLRMCLPVLSVNPLDVQFDFCLGDQGHSRARDLPFVPKDGGLN